MLTLVVYADDATITFNNRNNTEIDTTYNNDMKHEMVQVCVGLDECMTFKDHTQDFSKTIRFKIGVQ